jgi:hypothetical protein
MKAVVSIDLRAMASETSPLSGACPAWLHWIVNDYPKPEGFGNKSKLTMHARALFDVALACFLDGPQSRVGQVFRVFTLNGSELCVNLHTHAVCQEHYFRRVCAVLRCTLVTYPLGTGSDHAVHLKLFLTRSPVSSTLHAVFQLSSAFHHCVHAGISALKSSEVVGSGYVTLPAIDPSLQHTVEVGAYSVGFSWWC